ncbi:integration host factor subunit alpha [Paramagnetospirillum magnetotacticum]|uniref:integration host factor subunit alpha n=1 Tax=Paramagnetospirillum magnetotacticum TaxID=188 RepID=UPI0022A93A34|nr:integration host factor subunit alpha [Paramagnetospirillum magnetotacticum]
MALKSKPARGDARQGNAPRETRMTIMAEKTLTRSHLSEAIYQEVGLSHNESADLLESVLSLISEALAKGTPVKISSFGSFSVRAKKQRIGRNPKTGEEVPITPRRVLVFRPSAILKTRMNQKSAS